MIGADIAPGNHALCQGQLLSKTEYPEVFALLGTRYGPGDASNFQMPNFSGRSPMGLWPGGAWAASRGTNGFIGSSDAIIPPHDHNIAHQHGVNLYTSYDGSHVHVSAADNSAGFVVSGTFGNAGSANITTGGGGYVIHGNTSVSVPETHRHATNGSTDGGPTNSAGANGAVSVTNANIGPGIIVNFVMRMH
jgi:microcystin-dependent protein